MMDEYETLKPLQSAAEPLAAKADWPALYDLGVLAANRVPTAAAMCHHDMYVDLDLALESVDRCGGDGFIDPITYECEGANGRSHCAAAGH